MDKNQERFYYVFLLAVFGPLFAELRKKKQLYVFCTIEKRQGKKNEADCTRHFYSGKKNVLFPLLSLLVVTSFFVFIQSVILFFIFFFLLYFYMHSCFCS